MLEVKQPIEKLMTELLVAPSVGDILGNRGEIYGGKCYLIRSLIRIWPNYSIHHQLEKQPIHKQHD
jgi:hypothetical protein